MTRARYFLCEPFLNGRQLEIEESLHADLVRDHHVLVALWKVEESFSLAADAFVAFEKQLLLIALDYQYRRETPLGRNAGLGEYRRQINLSLVTFLAAAKAYQDHLCRLASRTGGDLGMTKEQVKAVHSQLEDDSLEYRVMETLRNQAVHERMPLGQLALGASTQWQDDEVSADVPSRNRITVDPTISCGDFCGSDKRSGKVRDKKSAKVRDEVAALGMRHLDLKFFVRGYVAQTSRGHATFRERSEGAFQAALAGIRSAAENHWPSEGKPASGLTVQARMSDGAATSHVVDLTHFEQVLDLRKGWKYLSQTRRAFVSSEIRQRADTFPDADPDLWIFR